MQDPTSQDLMFNKDDTDDQILEKARENVRTWYDYFSDNLRRAREDISFALLEQWDPEIKAYRAIDKKPTFEFNYLYAHVNALIGEQSQNNATVKVRATTSKVDQKEVDVRAGLIRYINYRCRSDIEEQEVFRSQLYGGWGALWVDVEYENSDTLNQIPYVYAIKEATTAFFDPYAKKRDKSDGRFCGYYNTLSKSDFHKEFPDAKSSLSFLTFANIGINAFTWGTTETVTIADIWVKEFFNKDIARLSDGQEMLKSEATQLIEATNIARATDPSIEPLKIIATRASEDWKIIRYKMIYDEILERTEWPSKELPGIYVDGCSMMVERRQVTFSYIDKAKDAQRYLNYLASESAYAVLNSRKEQWIGTPGQIKSFEQVWNNPQRTQGILLYNPEFKTQGRPPERVPPGEIPQTLTIQYQRAMTDIQNILGRFDANMGAESNERSGIAIANRAKQGNAPTFSYFDNLNQARTRAAKIILSLMPRIFDSSRETPIINSRGEQEVVTLNQDAGAEYKYDMTMDKFMVEVEAGPNYAIQKADAISQLMMLIQSNPQISQIIPDLIAANLDIENMPQIVERLKTIIPPQILAKESGQPMPPQPPNPQVIMEQQKMQLEQQKAQNEAKNLQLREAELELKARGMGMDAMDKHLQLETKAQDAKMQHHATQLKTMAEIKKANMDYDTAVMNHLHKRPPNY